MTEKKEEKKKTPPKAAAAQKAAAAKPAAEKKAESKSAPAKAAVAPKAKPAAKQRAANSGATVKIVQIGSPIGRQQRQRQTLIGLGLNKLRRERVLQDTPEVRGMIEKVKHLVKVVK